MHSTPLSLHFSGASDRRRYDSAPVDFANKREIITQRWKAQVLAYTIAVQFYMGPNSPIVSACDELNEFESVRLD